jgi:hypothetical protein
MSKKTNARLADGIRGRGFIRDLKCALFSVEEVGHTDYAQSNW